MINRTSRRVSEAVGTANNPGSSGRAPSSVNRGAVTERFYLHGDEHESSPGEFFCACCDLFAPAAHFNVHAPERHSSAIDRTQRLLDAYRNRPGKFTRPDSPPALRFVPPAPPIPSPGHMKRAALNRWGYRWGEGGGRRT
jgi:hypothetical protein